MTDSFCSSNVSQKNTSLTLDAVSIPVIREVDGIKYMRPSLGELPVGEKVGRKLRKVWRASDLDRAWVKRSKREGWGSPRQPGCKKKAQPRQRSPAPGTGLPECPTESSLGGHGLGVNHGRLQSGAAGPLTLCEAGPELTPSIRLIEWMIFPERATSLLFSYLVHCHQNRKAAGPERRAMLLVQSSSLGRLSAH